MVDGRVFEANQPHPRGGLEDPLPPAEIVEKFRANARLALPAGHVDDIVDTVSHLAEISSISLLTDKLFRR
jgi:hypothetical protein